MPDGGGFETAGWAAPFRAAAAVFAIVLAAAILVTRAGAMGLPTGFWPVNALALGLFLRLPSAARPAGWIAVSLALLLADLAAGAGPVAAAAVPALANLAGIGLGHALLARQPEEVRFLRQPASMLWVVAAAALAGLGTAIVAGILGGAGGLPLSEGFDFGGVLIRWGDEAVAYVALLPVLLAAPSPADLRARLHNGTGIRKTDLLPVVGVALSFALAAGVDEPGAIALPVLALLWCGLVFPVFLTTLVTLSFNLLVLAVLSGAGPVAGLEAPLLLSIRLAAAAVAIAPILLSILTHHRNALMARLHLEAIRDPLTGVLNRAAFREDAALILRSMKVPEGWPSAAAVLLIDPDGVAAINTAHGRAAGDEVLRELARRVGASLRQRDLIGRLDGEDFVAILRDCPPDVAVEVAERLLRAISADPIWIGAEQAVEVTASIGLTPVEAGRPVALDHLLNRAARALSQAKAGGGNRVMATGMSEDRTGHAATGATAQAAVAG